MENLNASLSLLKLIAHKFQEIEFPKNQKDKYIQIIILFFNRIIIDVSAIQLLIQTGHYGSARTLIAVTMRNLRMFASLIDGNKERIEKFWNEDESTYQTDTKFGNEFGETPSRKLAQQIFGKGAFDQIELEKSLHGSCHALRKFYTDRTIVDEKRIPVVRLGAFQNKSYTDLLYLLADGFVLDFLGVFFTRFNKHEDLKSELDMYLDLALIARSSNKRQEGV